MSKINAVKGEYVSEMLRNGIREDERDFMDYRDIKIQPGPLPQAEGSAQVDLGNTRVLAGVKIILDEPMPDKPNDGNLVVSAELLPLAAAEYEPGPPSPDAIEYARVVDRGIRAANVVDLPSLFIEEGKVWTTFVDIYVLNFDGNLFDAGTLAAVTALHTARLPKLEGEEVIRKGKLPKLKTANLISSCTFAKLGKNIILDPSAAEEAAMDTRLTITNDEKNVSAAQKGLNGAFSTQEIDTLIEQTFHKSKELRKKLNKAIGE